MTFVFFVDFIQSQPTPSVQDYRHYFHISTLQNQTQNVYKNNIRRVSKLGFPAEENFGEKYFRAKNISQNFELQLQQLIAHCSASSALKNNLLLL